MLFTTRRHSLSATKLVEALQAGDDATVSSYVPRVLAPEVQQEVLAFYNDFPRVSGNPIPAFRPKVMFAGAMTGGQQDVLWYRSLIQYLHSVSVVPSDHGS